MNFALGLEAANAYFREDDRRVLREQQRERYGWDKARNESELRLLPDREEASRSGYRDTVEANASRARLRPDMEEASRSGYRDTVEANAARSRLRPGETDLRAARTQAELDRQPDEAAAAATNAQIARSNADFNREQLPVTQGATANRNSAGLSNSVVDLETARRREEMIPQTLREMGAKGVLSAAEQSDAVLGVLARRIQSNDVQGALAFANQVAEIPGLIPGTDGKRFLSITPAQNGTDAAGNSGPGYIFKTDDGGEFFTSHRTMEAAYQRSLGNPKFKFFQDWRSGAVYTGDERTGRVTAAVAPDAQRLERTTTPGSGSGGRSSGDPADVKKAKWLISSGVAANENEAWQMVTTSKQKSRSAFIQDYVTKNTGMGTSDEDLARNAGKIYDQIRAVEGGPNRPAAPAAAPSNSAPAGTVPGSAISPEMKRLLGIK